MHFGNFSSHTLIIRTLNEQYPFTLTPKKMKISQINIHPKVLTSLILYNWFSVSMHSYIGEYKCGLYPHKGHKTQRILLSLVDFFLISSRFKFVIQVDNFNLLGQFLRHIMICLFFSENRCLSHRPTDSKRLLDKPIFATYGDAILSSEVCLSGAELVGETGVQTKHLPPRAFDLVWRQCNFSFFVARLRGLMLLNVQTLTMFLQHE